MVAGVAFGNESTIDDLDKKVYDCGQQCNMTRQHEDKDTLYTCSGSQPCCQMKIVFNKSFWQSHLGWQYLDIYTG